MFTAVCRVAMYKARGNKVEDRISTWDDGKSEGDWAFSRIKEKIRIPKEILRVLKTFSKEAKKLTSKKVKPKNILVNKKLLGIVDSMRMK